METTAVSHNQKGQFLTKFAKEVKFKISGLASVKKPINIWK